MTRDPYPLVSVVCDAAEIEKAIGKQITHGKYKHGPLFGDGKAGRNIADVLATVQLGSPQK